MDVFDRVLRKIELSGRVQATSECLGLCASGEHFANKCHKPKGSEAGKGGEFAPKDECDVGEGMDLDDALGLGDDPTPVKSVPVKAETSKDSDSKASVIVRSGGMGIPQPPFGGGDFNEKGKPNPGSDAWLHAHGIDRVAFADRPYHRFEEGQTFDDLPPEIQARYEGEPEAIRQLNKIMKQAPGYIMVRNSTDGSPIVPQTRPDFPIVTNPGAHFFKKAVYENAVKRAEAMKSLDSESVVALQEGRVERGKLALEAAKTMDREQFVKPAYDRIAAAQAALEAVRESGGDEIALEDAATAVKKAERTAKTLEKEATHYFGGVGDDPAVIAARTEEYRAVSTANAEKALANSQKKLERYKADPEAAIANEIEQSAEFAVKAKEAFDGTSVKYVFPPNPKRLKAAIDKGQELGKAGRVNAHEAENLKRLKEGHGRVYLAMEGSMKEDSLLSAIRAEGDKDSAVISVPSVTLWRNKEMAEVAAKFLQGREVVLIPDADGVNNPRVQNEARAMQIMLEGFGAKVVVAPPPIPIGANGKPIPDPAHPGKVMMFERVIPGSPTGVVEQLKGVDDYLGLGRGTPAKGTLGNLSVQGRSAPPALRDLDLVGVVDALAVPNAEKTLRAVSSIVGPVGSGRMGGRMLSAAIGRFYDHGVTASASLKQLAKVEIDGEPLIKVEHVFDPVELKRGRRVMHPDMTEARIKELVKAKVIERPAFGEDDTRPVEFGYEETPIVTIHSKYRAVDSTPSALDSTPRPKGYKANRTARIKNLVLSGKTYEEIAKMLKISPSAVSEALA